MRYSSALLLSSDQHAWPAKRPQLGRLLIGRFKFTLRTLIEVEAGLARYFAVVIERSGLELFRHKLQIRRMDEVADGLAAAFRSFRDFIPEDGLETRELTIRFEDRLE